MTPRERVIAALRCEKPDRIPKALGFFPQPLPALWGTVGTAPLWQYGTPAQIRC